MTEFPVPLDNLIAYVKAIHPDGEPLDRVTDSFAVSARLGEQSDALIGYFVDQARKSGASWSQIGSAMGVSKQAAQKRFVPGKLADITPGGGPVFSRFTQRARNMLAAAGRLASAQEAASAQTPASGQADAEKEPAAVGAAHLAAATLAEPEGVAGKAIVRAGLTPEQVYAALGTGSVTPGPDVTAAGLRELAFDDSGKAALKDALKAALRFGHNYIGTEHLLLGVLDGGGIAAEALGAIGLTPGKARELIMDEIAEIQAERREAGGQ